MTHCEFTGIDGGWRCETCGRVVKLASEKPPIATCRGGNPPPPIHAPAPPGLGDRMAAAFGAVGITKERAQAFASTFGLKDCGCSGRRAAMNALGHKYLGLPPGQTGIDPNATG